MTTVAPVSPLMPPSETSEAGALLIALRDELAATRKRLQDFVAKEGQSNGRDGLLLHEALLLHDVGLLARQPPYARTTRRHELLEEVAFPAGYTFDVSLPRPLGLVSEEMRSYTRSYAFNTLTMDVPTMMVHWFVMCQELDLLAKFNISATTLREFFRCVHNGYRDNTYHNFQHAMDVAQFTFALYSNVEEMREKFNDIDMLACVVLGLAHDMDHPGVNNAYLIKIRDPIAILYNDRSVLENAHAAGFFYMLMTRPGANILGNLEPAKYERVRKLILSGILATDMSRHFDLIKDIVKLTPAAEMSELDDKSRGALIDLVAKASDICHVVSQRKKKGKAERKR